MHTEAREKGGFMGWVFRDSLIEGDFLILGGPGWVRPTPCASIRHVPYARAMLSACGYPPVAIGLRLAVGPLMDRGLAAGPPSHLACGYPPVAEGLSHRRRGGWRLHLHIACAACGYPPWDTSPVAIRLWLSACDRSKNGHDPK